MFVANSFDTDILNLPLISMEYHSWQNHDKLKKLAKFTKKKNYADGRIPTLDVDPLLGTIDAKEFDQ